MSPAVSAAVSLVGRSIVSIDDLSDKEIEAIFDRAEEIEAAPARFWGTAKAKVLATLFHEPSTRTRLSFEAAMQRLGGGTISAWDVNASSASKGETLADTVRVIAGYADAIVLRHPLEGAAYLAARYAGVPIINGGDGGHEHPTQTLCDLYTIRKRHKKLKGLTVALCGDLKNGRTVHSLAFGLARFGANVVFVAGDNNNIPDYVLARLTRDYNARIEKTEIGILGALFGSQVDSSGLSAVNAVYMTPSKPHQLAMIDDVRAVWRDLEALYVTRLQKERLTEPGDGHSGHYPTVTAEVLRRKDFKDTSILHPLPRVDELSPDIDKDERSLYFQQAAHGLPIRMALLHFILGLKRTAASHSWKPYERVCKGQLYTETGGSACENKRCITRHEPQNAPRRFEVIAADVPRLRCLYCDQETTPSWYGYRKDKICYPANEFVRNRPRIANVVFFDSKDQAMGADFAPRDLVARVKRANTKASRARSLKA